jgi:Pyruvate/2-oxoacid:ferredoxin oxidoreductase delta subunit
MMKSTEEGSFVGHTTIAADLDVEYRLLQERLNRNVTGAPDSPAMQRILRLLFTPEDAHIARQLPQVISVSALARKLEVDFDWLDAKITSMAQRGLVLDFERNEKRYVLAAPVVIGFFEFTFMRERPDAPMEEYANAFEDLFDDEAFARSVFAGSTQIGRSFVREEAVTSEILDWERASHVVETAESVAVSLCPCRIDASLRGDGCDAPVRTCLTFGGAADGLVRSGLAEAISNEEALVILGEAKEAGLAQTGDTVREEISYMCSCCGCCCGMMRSIKKYDIYDGIMPSNFLATIDGTECRGCTKCAKACPVDAIEVVPSEGKGQRRNWALVDADRCLGCGVCDDVCRWDAHEMVERDDPPYIPEDTMERVALMAVERGKLGDLLMDNVGSKLGPIAAASLRVIERMPPWKAAMANQKIRSKFVSTMIGQIKKRVPAGL